MLMPRQLARVSARYASVTPRTYLKSPEEDNEAGELNKAQEVLGVVLPAAPLDPGEKALGAYSGLDGVDLA